MFRKSRLSILAALIAVLILLMSTGTFALAQEGGGEEILVVPGGDSLPAAPQAAVPGGPGFLMTSVSAFTPFNQATQYVNNLHLRTLPGSLSTIYTAPVSLPQGATINRLVYYFSDSDTTQNSQVRLLQWPVPGNLVNIMANVSSPISPTATWSEAHTDAISYELVDNGANVYILELTLPAASAGTVIYAIAVRIDYSYPVNIPLVTKQ